MKKIQSDKDINEIKPVNGIIEKDTIKVGTSGKIIDIDSSYEKMKKVNKYSENLLEYIDIKPKIKKDDNYDKLITGTITNERKISFVFHSDNIFLIKQIVYIINKNDIKATFYIDGKIIEDLKDLQSPNISIGMYSYNNIFSIISTKYMKNLLTKKYNYSNYCLYKDEKFLKICESFKINTIKPQLIEKNIYRYLKNNKEKGLIYQIKVNENNIRELNSTIIYLKQKGYKIEKIDDLLKE